MKTVPEYDCHPGLVAPSELELLLKEVSSALEGLDLILAFRLADRARRIAPRESVCVVLYARVLVLLGRASEAVELLEGRDEPEAFLAQLEALCALGKWEEAFAICRAMLHACAIDAIEGLSQAATRVCSARSDCRPPGWIGIDSQMLLRAETLGDGLPEIEFASKLWSPDAVSDLGNDIHSFRYHLPADASGQVSARLNGAALLGSELQWPPAFGLEGWVWLEEAALVGEARLAWAPHRHLSLALAFQGTAPGRLVEIAPGSGTQRQAFRIPLTDDEWKASQIEVTAVLPNGSQAPLVGSPIRLRRVGERIGQRPDRAKNVARVSASETERKIDVIIPVYAGHDETVECINSVLATTDPDHVEVVVVNDCSPERSLQEFLAGLTQDRRITLVINSQNRGFPAAANAGMRLHPDRDVVLLNSDTRVFGDWLDRMRAAAYANGDVGTITPLVETDSITQYCQDRPAFGAPVAAREIDRIARRVNAGKRVEIPVGVGFCLFIKRECLNETGEFDEDAFGRGYGEECDFCLRARKIGWCHLAAADVFVAHRGGRSFGRRDKNLLLARSRCVLNSLHPGYDELVAGFAARNPLHAMRRSIDCELLQLKTVSPVLITTLNLPGGVSKHVNGRKEDLGAGGHTVLVLSPAASSDKAGVVTLSADSLGLGNLSFDLPDELSLLRQVLASLSLEHIEIHHFLGLPPSALELCLSLGVPYDIYVHDYIWICPRVNLIDGTGRYCGEPPIGDCERCIQLHGSGLEESLSVSGLRVRSSRILGGARDVIAPSADACERLKRYFPGLQIRLASWESGIPDKGRSHRARWAGARVAVLGAIGVHKGYEVLLECARDAARRALNLEFVVVGYTVDDGPLLATGRVFISGPYREDEVDVLLDREMCNVAFFPSVWPETWCYALTHTLSRRLPVLAFSHGAFVERLSNHGLAELVPASASPASLNDALIRLSQEAARRKQPPEAVMDRTPNSTSPRTEDLTSSIQVLNLPEGVYSVTIKGGAGPEASPHELVLPAVQVSLAPGRSSGSVELLTGASRLDRWLAYDGDMIVVKIARGDASLMLTSVRIAESPMLEVRVNRLNAEPLGPAGNSTEAPAKSGLAPQVRLRTHIKNVGDLDFVDCWAGWPSQSLWIEAFSVSVSGIDPFDGVESNAVLEYRALTADGRETPWVTGEELCGNRGAGRPMLGFAVRLAAEFVGRYECAYGGKFFSGTVVGPLTDGQLCRSDVPGDPLEAIAIQITERKAPSAPGQDLVQSRSNEM